MFKLQYLIRRDMQKLAANITLEQGKTLLDAEGDVNRGLQVVEHACAVPSLQLGETLPKFAFQPFSSLQHELDFFELRKMTDLQARDLG